MQRPTPTFLAVVDRTGLLTPIAVFDGSEWWNRWPWEGESDEIKALPVPPTLADIPAGWLPEGLRLPATWTVLRPSGERVSIRALAPARRSEFDLVDTIVIRTTLPKRGETDPVDLVAIAGPGRLGRFVEPSKEDARQIAEQLRDAVAKDQQDAIRRWEDELRKNGLKVPSLTRLVEAQTADVTRYVPSAPAASVEIGLARADVVVAGNRYYYAVTSGGMYAMEGQGDCKMNLSTNGVAIVAGGRVISHRIASNAFSEFCGDFGESLVPLAALSLSGRTRWIARVDFEDGYDYVLLNPETGDPQPLKGTWSERRSRPQSVVRSVR